MKNRNKVLKNINQRSTSFMLSNIVSETRGPVKSNLWVSLMILLTNEYAYRLIIMVSVKLLTELTIVVLPRSSNTTEFAARHISGSNPFYVIDLKELFWKE